jgi:ribosomal protein S18 acetylase RimI-like enzyme
MEIEPMSESSANTAVRAMQDADLPAARMLWENTGGIGLSTEETPQMLATFLVRNPGISSVADDAAGRLIGAVLGGHDGRRGYLYHLAVAPERRGQGIARALVERTLAALAAAGITKASIVFYAANESGRAFWSHLGWSSRDDLQMMQRPPHPTAHV